MKQHDPKRWLEKLLYLISFAVLLSSCAAGPKVPLRVSTTEARVVDAETGAPIEGAVVKLWLEDAWGARDGDAVRCDVPWRETVTDADGRFVIEGWTQYCEDLQNLIFTNGGKIIIDKAGYWSRELYNSDGRIMDRIFWPDSWWSDWDGKDIELEPMHWREWTKEEWEKKGKEIWGVAVNYWENCQWLEFPLNVVENIKFRIRKREMIAPYLDVCGDGMEFLKRAKEQCEIDAFNLLRRYGLTEEEWEICLAGTKRTYIPAGKGKTIHRNTPKETIPLPTPVPRRIQELHVKPMLGEPVILPERDRPDHNMEGEQR